MPREILFVYVPLRAVNFDEDYASASTLFVFKLTYTRAIRFGRDYLRTNIERDLIFVKIFYEVKESCKRIFQDS